MNKVIWKFELSNVRNQGIELPIGYKVLAVQCKTGNPYLWVLVDPTQSKEVVTFEVYGTGCDIVQHEEISREYIGTWQELQDNYVWHLFKQTIK